MTQWIDQSFFFDWNRVTDPTPVPITAQCETIQIEWSRAAATGPDPIAPYHLEIFTSHYIFPFQIPIEDSSALSTNLTIPFAPGTQYQICMWDSVGHSGGCQAVYTVYAPSATASQAGQCSNFTMPANVLQVNSSAGQYAWIPSCTDLVLKPQSGTPPYQVTIAPALHPPYNISNVGSEGTSWKVQLMWGMPFFVAMTDSTGLTWSYGPLHAGEGSTECLGTSSGGVGAGALAGSIIGSLIIGTLLGFGLLYFLNRRKPRSSLNNSAYAIAPTRQSTLNTDPNPYVDPYHDQETSQPLIHNNSSEYYGSGSGSGDRRALQRRASSVQSLYASPQLSPGYHVEPFDPRSVGNGGETSPTLTNAPTESSMGRTARGSRSQQVYVVHHDQGPAPVSIYTQDGTEVVELPPIYSGGASRNAPGEEGGDRTPQPRPAGAAPPEVVQTLPGRRVSGSRRPEKNSSGPRPMPARPPP